jgi:membrane protein implicated in regulation of membrane protease activity
MAVDTGLGVPLSLLLLLAGGGLLVAEALAPGAHFMVIGIALLAAGLVGILLGGIVPAALMPLVLAAVVLAAGGGALYAYRRFDLYGGKGRERTSDSSSLRGKTGRVTERVTTTEGEVKLEEGGFNPYYRARSMNGDIEEGEEVLVLDPGGGNVITVASLSETEDQIDRELARGRELAERDRRERERAERDVRASGTEDHEEVPDRSASGAEDGDEERDPETESA